MQQEDNMNKNYILYKDRQAVLNTDIGNPWHAKARRTAFSLSLSNLHNKFFERLTVDFIIPTSSEKYRVFLH